MILIIKKSVVEIVSDFKNVSEANDLMEGLNQSGSMISGMVNGNTATNKASENDAVGVVFSFKKRYL